MYERKEFHLANRPRLGLRDFIITQVALNTQESSSVSFVCLLELLKLAGQKRTSAKARIRGLVALLFKYRDGRLAKS
jgi:hypothetical protein